MKFSPIAFGVSLLFFALGISAQPSQQASSMSEASKTSVNSVRANSSRRSVDTKSEIALQQIRSLPKNVEELKKIGTSQLLSFDIPIGDSLQLPRTLKLRDVMTAWCESNWTETCDGVERWNSPDGYEICKFGTIVESISHGEWSSSADKAEIRIKLKSWGSHAFFDQWGGWARVRLASVELILKGSSETDRNAAGCSLANNGGGPSGSKHTENAFCLSDPFQPGVKPGTQMCQDFIYESGVKKLIGAPYPCGVCLSN